MATFKHTGVGNGTARTHYTSIAQLQDGSLTELGTVAGTDTITAALTPAITAYAQGQLFSFIPANTNTGAVTIDINSVGAVAITKRGATALAAGDIVQNVVALIEHDGTQFQLLNPQDVITTSSNSTLSGDITFGGEIIVPSDGELTISSGAITITGAAHSIDTESDAASDDLDTISGGSTGSIVEFRLENAARDVVFKHGTGNISNPSSLDITMGAAGDRIYYKYDGSNWIFLFKNFGLSSITLGTPQASTSGTSIDFTGIPSTAKQIHINFAGMSTSGTSIPIIQLGDSGGIENTGYVGSGSGIFVTVSTASFTSGFGILNTSVATYLYSGTIILTLLNQSTNTWAATGVVAVTGGGTGTGTCGGYKALSAVLDRVRITTVGATDTFDAGEINITYQ